MPDLAFFTELLQSNYDTRLQSLRAFTGSVIGGVRAVLQVELTNGTLWVMRAYREGRPVPDWLVGCAANTTPLLY